MRLERSMTSIARWERRGAVRPVLVALAAVQVPAVDLAAVEHVVGELIAVLVFCAPDERQQSLLILAPSEAWRRRGTALRCGGRAAIGWIALGVAAILVVSGYFTMNKLAEIEI